MTDCPHCKIPMRVGQNVYTTEDGEHDVEYYHYCDECGAEYGWLWGKNMRTSYDCRDCGDIFYDKYKHIRETGHKNIIIFQDAQGHFYYPDGTQSDSFDHVGAFND